MFSNAPVAARHLVFMYSLIGLLIVATSYLIVLERRHEQPDAWKLAGRALQLEIVAHSKGCEDGVKKLTK